MKLYTVDLELVQLDYFTSISLAHKHTYNSGARGIRKGLMAMQSMEQIPGTEGVDVTIQC